MLIGAGGWRAQAMKQGAGLTRLTFGHSKEYDGPLAELVGSRDEIRRGLQAIARTLTSKTSGMSLRQRERCGDVEAWTAYRDEFVEDLGISKKAFKARMRCVVSCGVFILQNTALTSTI